jgi:hypothetical protein
MQSKYRQSNEIEERRPNHCREWPQHAGRDDRSDRVRCIVQAVEKVKGESKQDKPDERLPAEVRAGHCRSLV